jgi:hypothetical protein
MWVGAALVLVAMPVKVFGGTGFHYGLELPVAVPQVDAMVDTALGPAPLKLDAARAELRLPIPMLPWSLVAVLWIYTAAAATLTLLLLHNVRLIFQRVRDIPRIENDHARECDESRAVWHHRHASARADRLGDHRQLRLGAHSEPEQHSDQWQHHRLFAQQLRTERPDAEDVGHVVGIPTLR